METQEKINIITVILFLLTGILHLLIPLIYGMTFETTGSFVFGIIYTCLGILVQLKKENKIIGILSILMPLIGLITIPMPYYTLLLPLYHTILCQYCYILLCHNVLPIIYYYIAKHNAYIAWDY